MKFFWPSAGKLSFFSVFWMVGRFGIGGVKRGVVVYMSGVLGGVGEKRW